MIMIAIVLRSPCIGDPAPATSVEFRLRVWRPNPTLSRLIIGTGSLYRPSASCPSPPPSRRRILGKIVKLERYFLAVERDLKDAIDKIVRHRHGPECCPKQRGLHSATEVRHDDDKACVQRSRRVDFPEIGGVIRDQYEVAFGCIKRATFQSFQPALPIRATCWASWPAAFATGIRSVLRHSSIRILIRRRARSASAAYAGPVRRRATADREDGHATDKRRHKAALGAPSRS